jgi:hypothetical protein
MTAAMELDDTDTKKCLDQIMTEAFPFMWK